MPVGPKRFAILAGLVLMVVAVPALVISLSDKTAIWTDFTIWIYQQQRDWQRGEVRRVGRLAGSCRSKIWARHETGC